MVLAARGLGKIASEEILGQIGPTTFATRTFDSLPEALKWVAGDEEQVKPKPR